MRWARDRGDLARENNYEYALPVQAKGRDYRLAYKLAQGKIGRAAAQGAEASAGGGPLR